MTLHRLHVVGKAPLAVAALVATPLFFCALMAASLAVERPRVLAIVVHSGKRVYKFGEPTTWSEAEIWLLALAVAAIALLVGLVAMFVLRGTLLVSLAGVLLPLAVTHRIDEWTAHHTTRFPYGVDLINDSSTSNLLLQGEWEDSARVTALQLSWVALGIAGTAALVVLAREARRRYVARREAAAT